ncbi:hypothetical protein HWV00_20855 (plasmid) [Moritella sp. 24]|uniref:hypothetical protein n=1 Tax=Moritella sp. 24 TaxID=2746230 RepID=UPI001BA61A44|nr:hypothetical protein [Moritella sp. 24]QUM78724.1 hypothetical protein HWV00_20855 [Moritella sp. 24]
MDQKTKDLITAIRSGPAYENPTKDVLPQVASQVSLNSSKVATLIVAIDASIPEPPPAPGPSSLTEKVIPPLEQSWMDRLNAVSAYCATVNAGCSVCNSHVAHLASTFSENIGLHNMGASVLEEMDGDGIDKFNQAYDLVKYTALSSMNDAVILLNDIHGKIPSRYSKDDMERELIELEQIVSSGLNYNQYYDNLIKNEKNIKGVLVQAAKDSLLASQSQTWASSEHTAEIVAMTGSTALKDALK